ncbi:MAG: ECF transporter S component [Clostridiales bacterium]|jgi:hypothetical protein|nr:ECF transporter S component [Clostridiales bacterium]
MTKAIVISRTNAKVQTLAILTAIVAAVALPQVFHAVGTISGLGAGLGQTFLPMYLPIIAVGFLAGPFAGAVSGALAPLVSFALSGMPTTVLLPFIMVELAVFGLSSGLLYTVKMPTILKVISAQLSGRIAFAVAVMASIYLLGNETVGAASILNGIKTALPGYLLQWAIMPLLIFRIENINKREG